MAVFRDEDYHILSKIKHKLKNEGNDFLGQKIIDVRALNGSSDIWYSLGQLRAEVVAAGDGNKDDDDDDDGVAVVSGFVGTMVTRRCSFFASLLCYVSHALLLFCGIYEAKSIRKCDGNLQGVQPPHSGLCTVRIAILW